MLKPVVTLEQHLIEEERKTPGASGHFTGLMTAIAFTAKVISREVRRAGLGQLLGDTDGENTHGERQKKLDIVANDLICRHVLQSGHLCAVTSEELSGLLPIPQGSSIGKYTLAFDPLDGSSNIDYGVGVGTIFSIHRRRTPGPGPGDESDLLQCGHSQVAAGYVIYGSSTLFVYSAGCGLHGFTLDPTIGEFVLSHENVRTPSRGRIYSANEAYTDRWTSRTAAYLNYLRSEHRPGGPASARYVGSLVMDFHRNLLAGGVFIYPADTRHPEGKLRLLYEAAPLAFLAEQAGGAASTGFERILDIQPTNLHQTTPLYIGSSEDVREAEIFLSESRIRVGAIKPTPTVRQGFWSAAKEAPPGSESSGEAPSREAEIGMMDGALTR